MSVLATILLSFTWPTIHLEKQGFTDANFVQFYQVGNQLLVVGTVDDLLVLYGNDGKVMHSLEGTRYGLRAPMVLGITEKEVLVIGEGSKLKGLDHQLNLLERAWPLLSINTVGGRYIGGGFFLVNTYGNSNYALTAISLNDGMWSVDAEMMPVQFKPKKPGDTTPQPLSWVSSHTNFAFEWRPIPNEQAHYSVGVFDLAQDASKILTLQSEIERPQDQQGLWAYVDSVHTLDERFYVSLVLANVKTGEPQFRFRDTFDSKGKALKRVVEDPYLRTKEVSGDTALLQVHSKTLKVTVFEP